MTLRARLDRLERRLPAEAQRPPTLTHADRIARVASILAQVRELGEHRPGKTTAELLAELVVGRE